MSILKSVSTGKNVGAYRSWRAMKNRCFTRSHKNWKDYGGRGIGVCSRWMSFEKFFLDMGLRPNGKTLDRIDPNLGYFPENCRWATISEQRLNRRTAVMITLNGKRQNQSEWARELGIDPSTIIRRRRRGVKDPYELLSKVPLVPKRRQQCPTQ